MRGKWPALWADDGYRNPESALSVCRKPLHLHITIYIFFIANVHRICPLCPRCSIPTLLYLIWVLFLYLTLFFNLFFIFFFYPSVNWHVVKCMNVKNRFTTHDESNLRQNRRSLQWAQDHWFYALRCCLFFSSHPAFNSINRAAGALGSTTDKLQEKRRGSSHSFLLSFFLLFFIVSGGVTCKCDTSHSEWFCLFLHDFRGAILTLSPPQVSSLKSKLKKQSTATGSGVARAFLRSQAALFGSYRDALRYKPVSSTSASPSLSSEFN